MEAPLFFIVVGAPGRTLFEGGSASGFRPFWGGCSRGWGRGSRCSRWGCVRFRSEARGEVGVEGLQLGASLGRGAGVGLEKPDGGAGDASGDGGALEAEARGEADLLVVHAADLPSRTEHGLNISLVLVGSMQPIHGRIGCMDATDSIHLVFGCHFFESIRGRGIACEGSRLPSGSPPRQTLPLAPWASSPSPD